MKKNKLLTLLLFFIIISSFSYSFSGGDGSVNNPYQISNWTDLNDMRNNLTSSFILINNLSSSDIDYDGIGNRWTPVGAYISTSTAFKGNLNGNGNIISDLIRDERTSVLQSNLNHTLKFPQTDFGTTHTIAFTILRSGIGSYRIIGSDDVDCGGIFYSGTTITYRSGNCVDSVTKSYTYSIGTSIPTRIVFVVNKENISFYADGVHISTSSLPLNQYFGFNPDSLLRHVSGTWSASLSEVLITNDTKDQTWVTRDYNNYYGRWTTIENTPNLVALWHLSEGSGSTSEEVIGGLNLTNITGWSSYNARYSGLFGWTSGAVKLININLNNSRITGNGYTGSLVGRFDNSINIINCSVYGNVTSTHEYSGGIVGYGLNGYIDNVSFIGNLNVYNSYGGGIAGLLSGNINNAKSIYNMNVIVSSTKYYFGGLGGHSLGDTTNSYSIGNITIISDVYQSHIGGLYGYNTGNINKSFSISNIHHTKGNNQYIGGFVGRNGFLGQTYPPQVENCYSGGIINVSGFQLIGGFTGESNSPGMIKDSFSYTKLELNGSGFTDSTNYNGINCYWDIEASNKTTSSNKCVGKTTEQLQTVSTFNNWNISESYYGFNINNNYPYLGWQNNTASPLWLLPTNFMNIYPTNGTVIERNNSVNISVNVGGGNGWNATIFKSNETNTSLVNFTNTNVGDKVFIYLTDLPYSVPFNWFVKIYNSTTEIISKIFTFTPNDEPQLKNVYAKIELNNVTFSWENEMDMEWVSLYLGNEWLELRSITSQFDSWILDNVYPGRTYLFKWQVGDNLLSMSELYNFAVRSYGWNTDMNDYNYRRKISIDKDNILIDEENGAINLTLDEENFVWCSGSNWWDSCYPAFTNLNWTTLDDIRFYNDYDVLPLEYEVTYSNIPHSGGQRTQTIPDEVYVTGSINDFEKMYDGDWNSNSVPAPYGVYYFNYTLDEGVKTNSMYRSYDGEWFWDGQLPIDCYGGDKLRFKKEIDYDTPYIKNYCQNNTDNSWVLFWTSTSAHTYETMMTFLYDVDVHILVKPKHFNDDLQTLTDGIDGDYNTSFYMYYGNSEATNEETIGLTYSSLHTEFIMNDEENHILGIPIISNINDTNGRTTTGTNISWHVDQDTDNRIKLSNNEWMLDSYYYSSLKTITETIEQLNADNSNSIKLKVYGDDWVNLVSIVCSNTSYNSNYTLNYSTGNKPVEIYIPDLNVNQMLDWTITYTENKSWDRNTQRPVFDLENLKTDTQYWYKLESYGTVGNSSSEIQTFILGELPNTPTGIFLNYTENRPNKQVNVCANLNDMAGYDEIVVNFQYFNQTDISFKETSENQMTSLGNFCSDIDTSFGEDNIFRAKYTYVSEPSCDGYFNDYCYYYFYDQNSCESYSNWNNNCYWYESGYCEYTGNCEYNFYDQSSCSSEPGCYWNEYGYCYDSEYNYITEGVSEDDCYNYHGGSIWEDSGSCYTARDCYSEYEQSGCEVDYACYWTDNSYCDGYLSCEGQEQDACSYLDSYTGGGCYLLPGENITGFSNSYNNLFDNKYEFFIGNPVEDNQMYLDRQYCPLNEDGTTNTSGQCYEQLGYREGSIQEEEFAYVETTNMDATRIEIFKYNNGTQKNNNITYFSYANYSLSESQYDFKYTTLNFTDSSFYTFKLFDEYDNLVLNWVKPSLTHRATETRVDENAFISFNGEPEPLNYSIFYFKTPGTYNTSAYQWCQSQPTGNLYDCMSVQYWGESTMGEELSGTKYDRGQFFRGGITNGEPADSGLMQKDRNINSLSGEYEEIPFSLGQERFCYAFTIYYFDDSIIPSNNITNYYARYWREDEHYSSYLGIDQESTLDYWSMFQWEFDNISMTRDWKAVDGSVLYTPEVVKTLPDNYFNSGYSNSLIVGYMDGFDMDVSDDKIYKSGVYFDGQWVNQQIGLHQQGFTIVNLPDNETLQIMDTDLDSLNDYDELFVYYSNPFSDDTDEDGMLDGLEVLHDFDINDWTKNADCITKFYNGCEYIINNNEFTISNGGNEPVLIYMNLTNALLHNSTSVCGNFSKNITENTGYLSINLSVGETCNIINHYDVKEDNNYTNDIVFFNDIEYSSKILNVTTLDKIEGVNVSFKVINCDYVDGIKLSFNQSNFSYVTNYFCNNNVLTFGNYILNNGLYEYVIDYNVIGSEISIGGGNGLQLKNITLNKYEGVLSGYVNQSLSGYLFVTNNFDSNIYVDIYANENDILINEVDSYNMLLYPNASKMIKYSIKPNYIGEKNYQIYFKNEQFFVNETFSLLVISKNGSFISDVVFKTQETFKKIEDGINKNYNKIRLWFKDLKLLYKTIIIFIIILIIIIGLKYLIK